MARLQPMIGIAITPAAYNAIKTTMLPRIDAALSPGADGLIRIWLDPQFVDRLGRMRCWGETYSDVILRLAKTKASTRL
jgi:hypothetical protein